MSKGRVIRLMVIWVVVAGAVTAWVATRTEGVSAWNAMLVGAVVATLLAVVLRGPKRG